MSTPSLLNIPYVIKSGKLYSQIPESGLGDFTATRTTTPTANRSTMVNANGLIELVNDGVPRLDYPLGGAVNGCPALLVEPSATNLALQSEAIGTSPWGTNNATVTANAISSPDNNLTADQINYTANTASRVFQTIASSNSTTYTYSVFIKNNTFLTGELSLLRFENNLAAPNDFEIRAVIDPTNIGAATFSLIGTAGTGTSGTVSGSVQHYGNGWWRVRVTGTTGTAAASATANIRIQQSSSVIARSIYAWGAQLETGSVATSYIPTTTAAITRGGEVIRKTGITSLIGQSEGTVYFEVEITDEARNKWISTLDSAANSFIQMWVSTSRNVNFQIQNAGTSVMSTLTSSALSVGYHKVAFAYNTATNGCIMYVDGVQNPVLTRTVTPPGLPAFNNMTFGGYQSTTTDSLKAHIRSGAVYPNRLSNTELIALTT